MVDEPLHERLEPLLGWDDMDPEERFEACRTAHLLVLLDRGVGCWSYEEIVEWAAADEEDLDDFLSLYITDPAEPTRYYNISDVDQFAGNDAMPLLCNLFPELENSEGQDFDAWLQAFVRRARLGEIAGRVASAADPRQL